MKKLLFLLTLLPFIGSGQSVIHQGAAGNNVIWDNNVGFKGYMKLPLTSGSPGPVAPSYKIGLNGMMAYDSTNKIPYINNGTSWVAIGSSNSPSSQVLLRTYATGGLGTSASPYTGWEAAIPNSTASNGKTFDGEGFVYASPNTLVTRQITRDATFKNFELRYTGSTAAPVWDWYNQGSVSSNDSMVFNCAIDNVILDGRSHGTRGLYITRFHHGEINRVRVFNCSDYGFWLGFLVCTNIHLPEVSSATRIGSPLQTTANGLIFDADNSGVASSDCTVFNPIMEQFTAYGIRIMASTQNIHIINGTGENSTGVGIRVESTCHNIELVNMDNEDNAVADYQINGNGTKMLGCLSAPAGSGGGITDVQGGRNVIIDGGRLNYLTLGSGAIHPKLRDAIIGDFGGSLTNLCSTAIFENVYDAANSVYLDDNPNISSGGGGLTYAQSVIADNPIYYNKLNGATSTQTPTIGSANIAITGGTFQQSGAYGASTAVQFAGGTDKGILPIDLSAYNDIAIELWAYFDASATNAHTLINIAGDWTNTVGGFAYSPVTTVGNYLGYNGTSSLSEKTFPAIPGGANWHHIVIRVSHVGAQYVLVDGVQKTLTGTNTAGGDASTFSSQSFYLMCAGTAAGFNLAGKVQDLAIYAGTIPSISAFQTHFANRNN